MRTTNNMKMPRILKNFRRGFATNSSSSHSFVYLKKESPRAHEDYIGETKFQWNDFRLETIKEKLFYVLSDRIGGRWNIDKSEKEEDFQMEYSAHRDDFPELSEDDFRVAYNGYGVDHNSSGTIGIIEARDPKVVVFGGNDNDGRRGGCERSRAISNGEVDPIITHLFNPDEPSRDEVPFYKSDKVKINGSKHTWDVAEYTHKDKTKVRVSRWDKDKRKLITEKVPVEDVVIVSKAEDGEYWDW